MASSNDVQEEDTFAKLHGCQPPQSEFKHRWPWALDLIKRHVGTVLTDHALMLQVEFTETLGITFAAYMFCLVGYFTSDPRNIKAITETRFQGRSRPTSQESRITDWRPRYGSGRATACLLPILRRGNLHSRWSSLEALPRNAPATIRTCSS